MEREKLLFIYPKLFTFIDTEIKILSGSFEVIIIKQNWTNKFLLPINFFIQFIYLLFNIHKFKVILVSFGGYWSFLPVFFSKLFNKKIAIVVHGTDCVSFPEINYGNLRSPLMRFFTAYSYRKSDIILPVSQSLVDTENTYYKKNEIYKFGYLVHLSNITTPHTVIPNGLILNDWNPNPDVSKIHKTFISVMTKDQLLRKGANLIFKTANLLPDCTFYIAGTANNEVDIKVSENVIFLGRLSPSDLKIWYEKTQFYLQLSLFEGFGVAICEAMLCKCIPIVSNVNYLPEIAKNVGFVLNHRDTEMLYNLIISIFSNDKIDNHGTLARDRILKNYSSENRRDMIIDVLNRL